MADPVTGEALRILNVLLTAEKVETALYAAGLQSGVLAGISADDLTYFQAATSEEFVHARLLEALGASMPVNNFFFPPGIFTNRTMFLNLIEQLETNGIGAYSAAIFRFASDLMRPDLALLAARILGVEAEHRVLARVVNDKNPPDDRCIEAVPTLNFDQIAASFLPFLMPNQFNGQSVGPIPFPDAATVDRLVAPNACKAV
ncbi:MAG TPA: ferritin-like domain-containing protein [Symbiobacteriaceae bacterium]|jgi:hypothetical protein